MGPTAVRVYVSVRMLVIMTMRVGVRMVMIMLMEVIVIVRIGMVMRAFVSKWYQSLCTPA